MSDKTKSDETEKPVPKDVEPGSDADETPVAEPGKTPPDPNAKPSTTER